jgi:hypothetical protein
LGLLVAIIIQSRSISQLRQENELLHAQQQSVPADVTSQPVASTANEANDVEQIQKDRIELIRLRNEVRQLREQASSTATNARPIASQSASTNAPVVQASGEAAKQLAEAAMGGDYSALDKLADLAATARTMPVDEQAAARAAIESALNWLGTEAGKGNTAALQAVWQATRVREIQGFAVKALGQAAALGNEEALKPLLDPEKYLIFPTSAAAALKPAADAGNESAIQALAATAADPKNQSLGLGLCAAFGLEKAAAAGNSTAIDGLATLAATDNPIVRRQAVAALEAAARKNQPRAEAALRTLGWR